MGMVEVMCQGSVARVRCQKTVSKGTIARAPLGRDAID